MFRICHDGRNAICCPVSPGIVPVTQSVIIHPALTMGITSHTSSSLAQIYTPGTLTDILGTLEAFLASWWRGGPPGVDYG